MIKFKLKILSTLIFAVLLSTILFSNVFTPSFALGEKYLRVIDDKTILYSDEFCSKPVSYLPYTYYVKVLEYKEGCVHVECFGSEYFPALDGYVLLDSLYEDNLPVSSPYLSLKVKTAKTCMFFSDTELSINEQFVFSGREMDFYGYYKNSNQKYVCLVGYNGKLGYVEESQLEPFDIAIHPNELTFLVPEPDDETDLPVIEPEVIPPQISENNSKDNSKQTVLRIAIVACLVIAGLIAIIVSIKPKKQRKSDSFYDENDYE